ncbi:MAG: signal peptide peptidase SppA, partial [Lentisphaeria bacterium]|nr:signal peptide peptidase SppA [Lentisphaeria bacterium]
IASSFEGAAAIAESDNYTTEFVSGNPRAEKKIAVIDVKGTITSDTDSFGTSIANSKDIVKLIRAAVKDDAVKAIIIDLDTPGGEVTASDEIYHELKLCEKPVVAMMNTMAASGGYYVACGADKIVANRNTMTGSIGVIISTVNVSELLEWAKVKPEFYTSCKMKAMLNPATPTTEEEEKVIKALVMNAYEDFAGIVAEARNIPLEKITNGELGDGRVFDGKQALENGLVDELGYFSAAEDAALELAKLTRDDCRIERFKTNASLADILGLFGVKAQPVTFNSLLSGTNVVLPKAGCPYYLVTGF